MGEQAGDPQVRLVVVLEVVDHPVDAEQVGVVGIGIVFDEVAQCGRVVRCDALVGVEEHDPARIERRRRREQPGPVPRVVPARVRGPNGVLEHLRHEWAGVEARPRVVGAPVVEGDDDIGEPSDALEPAVEVLRAVANREQAGEERTVHRRHSGGR